MITITPLDQLGMDERGGTYTFDTDRTGPYMVTHRRAGSASGRHFHHGVSPKKNPEHLILMKGTVQVNWKNMRGPESGSVHVEAPARIVIPAWVWHEVIAETDFVMLELNGPEDGREDTYRDVARQV
jgi:hypothetical protein